MRRLQLAIIIFFLPAISIFCQEPACSVLVKSLQGTYEGGCKKGLAHGKGVARGIDMYTGSFRKGYPDGRGTYKWAAGDQYEGFWKMGNKEGEGIFRTQIDGKDTIIAGIWKDDKYTGPKPIAPEILMNNGIKSVNFSRMGDGNTVTVIFMQAGSISSGVSNLIIFGNSGNQFSTGTYQGYERVLFPFKGRVTYHTLNAFKTGSTDCVLEFRITQPGRWEVKIYN
jgi:hypothetical protein